MGQGQIPGKQYEPVWKRPGWITAIVGVLSVFLTVPDKVANYYAKQQEIRASQISNERERQSNEFQIIQNTLAQQGPERVFLLRYFAATLDDEDAKNWAQSEVNRLDKLVKANAELKSTGKALEVKQAEHSGASSSEKEKLNNEIKTLASTYEQKNLEVSALRQEAGLVERQYWVIVGSFQSRQDAQQLVDAIKQETTEMSPMVGIQNAQGIWPVIVGYGNYSEAKKLKEKAQSLSAVTNEPYLAPF